MFQRAGQLLFVVILFVSFIEMSYSYSVGSSTCHTQAQDVLNHSHKETSDSEDHCPFEAIHHCCHFGFILLTESLPIAENLEIQDYSDYSDDMKPSLYSDGPFHPPRT